MELKLSAFLKMLVVKQTHLYQGPGQKVEDLVSVLHPPQNVGEALPFTPWGGVHSAPPMPDFATDLRIQRF